MNSHAPFDARPHDLWMMRAKFSIKRRRCADAEFVEHFDDAPDANAIAVVALRPRPHGRRLAFSLERMSGKTRLRGKNSRFGMTQTAKFAPPQARSGEDAR